MTAKLIHGTEAKTKQDMFLTKKNNEAKEILALKWDEKEESTQNNKYIYLNNDGKGASNTSFYKGMVCIGGQLSTYEVTPCWANGVE